MHEQLNRRSSLKALAAAAAGTCVTTATGNAAISTKPLTLKDGATILFQGDSITDAGRNRKDGSANAAGALGRGYPYLISSYLLMRNPTLNLKCYNRGISGHKVPDLDARWKKDCIDLKPDVLSILIGVNDIWHKLNGKYEGTVEVYGKGFAELIRKTQEALPEAAIVICEPFALKCGAVNDKWFPEFDQRRAAAKRVAEAAGTRWVAFQAMFDASTASGVKPEYWGRDGVHPSAAGHALMALNWLTVAGLD